MATTVEKTVLVNVPVRTAYNQWTQFEQFPRFMSGVKSVTQLDDRTLEWVTEVGGVRRQWQAAILEQVRDRRVAWAATQGATNAGMVEFTDVGGSATQVHLELEYEPEGLMERIGDKLNVVENQAEKNLERFKAFIDSGGSTTEAWRRAVAEGAPVGTPGAEEAAASSEDAGKAGVSGTAMDAGVAAAGTAVSVDNKGTDKEPATIKEPASGQTDLSTDAPLVDEHVQIPAGGRVLQGHLHLPTIDAPVVILADSSGSSRHSSGIPQVAGVLQQAGLGTVVLDLLTAEEAADRASVFDVPVLAQRFTAAMAWAHQQPHSMSSPMGFFGTSAGAAAALWAAAEPDVRVEAVVSHSGRPDVAGERLGTVRAPTMLIIGKDDQGMLELTRQAQARLRCKNRLIVMEGAGHAFEEPGTLEAAAALARDWFTQYLSPSGDASMGVSR